jgi:hypothetical protein
MTKVRHITFGTPNFASALRQLRSTAAEFGVKTYAYTSAHPRVADLARRHPQIMRERRGGGYWLWKPAIILDALENSDDGTLVMYTDAAMHMIADPRPMLVCALDYPIMLFEHTFPVPAGPISFPMAEWTKRDAFVLLGADTSALHAQQQLMSGVQIYRNNPATRDFLQEVIGAMGDARVLTDIPNTQGLDNLPGFHEHRHDQSILSIVAWRHKLPHFPDPTQWGHRGPRPVLSADIDGVDRPATRYGQVFYLHRRRTRGALRMLISRLNPVRTGPWRNFESDLSLTGDTTVSA